MNIINRLKRTFKGESKEQGVTGSRLYWGHMDEDEFNTDWQDTNREKKFDNIYKMINTDGIINAVTSAIKLIISQSVQEIKPGTQDNIDLKIADEVKIELFENPNFSWTEIINHILLYREYGFYLFEKVPYFDGSKNRIFKIAKRMPRTITRWEREDRKLKRVEQYAQTDEVNSGQYFIDNENLLLFTNKREGDNYIGVSDLRAVWRNWRAKDMLIRMSLIGYDRHTVPPPLIKLPENEQSNDYEKAQDFGQTYRSHEKGYGVLPFGFDLSFPEIQGNVLSGIRDEIKYHNFEIVSNYLASFMTLGDNTTGSYSMHKDKSDMFYISLEAMVTYIEDIINERNEGRALVKDYVDWNYSGVKKYPEFKISKIANVDYNAFAETLSKLASSGMISPSQEIENHLIEELGLPESETVKKVETKPVKIETKKEDSTEIETTACGCEINLQDEDTLLFTPNRELTDVEKKVLNLNEIVGGLNEYKKELWKTGDKYRTTMISKLLDKAKTLLAKNVDSKEFNKQIKTYLASVQNSNKFLFQTAMTNELTGILKKVWQFGGNQVKTELVRQGLKVKLQDIIQDEGQKMLRPFIEGATQTLVNKLTNEWRKEIARQKMTDTINIDLLSQILVKLSKNDFKREMTEKAMSSFGAGRKEQATKYKDQIEMVIRSEILDSNLCANCKAIDGKEFDIDSPEFQSMAAGPYSECEGGLQCRGINIFSIKD